jgi:hypothetical protein
VTVLSVDELLATFAAVSARLVPASLTPAQFEVLTGVVWDKQRECREHMEHARSAAQRDVHARTMPQGIGPAPRMLPGFGPAPVARGTRP